MKSKNLFSAIIALCLLALCACWQAQPEETAAPTTTTASAAAPTTTTETPATVLIEYPASYRDAPAAYKPNLDALYALEQLLRQDKEGELFAPGSDTFPLFQDCLEKAFIHDIYGNGGFGYAIKDINKDGIVELIILQNEEENFMCSIYTLKHGKPVNLDYYGRRFPGRLTADGTIYQTQYGGTSRFMKSSRLKAGASELTLLTEYYMEHPDCYKGAYDGEREPITEEEWEAVWEQYSNPPNPMPLTFIPIEQ